MLLQRLLLDVVHEARRCAVPVNELEKAMRRQYFLNVLAEQNFNQCGAARAIGIHRNTFNRMLAPHNLNIDVRELKRLAARKRPVKAVPAVATASAYRGA